MATIIVDSPASVVSLLNDLENQPTSPPSLYLDIEGINLSRHGSISIIQLFLLPQNRVFLLDIFILREAAFDTFNSSGTTLRSILESPSIPKVFFDVRNDADALFAHFNVSLQNVHDVQLLKVATRSWPKDRVTGLGKCIKSDAQLSVEARRKWEATKERGRALFAEEAGGSYEVFNVRPMLQDIIDYCVGDVVHLPILWETYWGSVSRKWLQRVQTETKNRVLISQTDSYEPHERDKVLSPWAKTVKEGTKNGPKETRGKQSLGDRKPAVGETEQGKRTTVAEVSAAKTLHRKVEKQLREDLTRQSPAETVKPRASKPFADLLAARTSPTITKTTLERPFPHSDLPTRTKKVTAKIDTELTSTIPDNEWKCTTCSRKMLISQQKAHQASKTHVNRLKQMSNVGAAISDNEWTCTTCSRKMAKSQQQDHEAGKAHINRLKQMLSAGATSESPLQTTTVEKLSPQAATTISATTKNPKPRPRKATQQGRPGSGRKKNRGLGGGPAGTSSSQPPGHPAHPNWGFIGFEQSGTTASYEYSGYYSEKGDDFGLCDKDCGWCGHCMDNVDFDF